MCFFSPSVINQYNKFLFVIPNTICERMEDPRTLNPFTIRHPPLYVRIIFEAPHSENPRRDPSLYCE